MRRHERLYALVYPLPYDDIYRPFSYAGGTLAQGAPEAPQWLSSDSEIEQAGEWRCLEFTTLEEGLR